jgi:hypothetical protein
MYSLLPCFSGERMRTVSPEEWVAILARAKQKKAQEEGADPTAALIVQDTTSSKGVKRRRKAGVTKPAKSLKAEAATTSSLTDKGVAKNMTSEKQVSRDEGASHTMVGEDVSLNPPSPSPVEKADGGPFQEGSVVPPLPLGDSFDPVDFIKNNFVLEGNLERFESMGVPEIRKLALGFEFKGLMLNYFLSARQEKNAEAASKKFQEKLDSVRQSMETSHAIYVEELVDSHQAALEKAKSACEDQIDALKKVYAQDRLDLEKRLLDSEKGARNLVKSRNGLIVALVMAEDDVAGFEEEVVELEESNGALKDADDNNFDDVLSINYY